MKWLLHLNYHNSLISNNLNSPLLIKEIELVILKPTIRKTPVTDYFTGEFQQLFKEKLTSIVNSLFQKTGKREKLPISL